MDFWDQLKLTYFPKLFEPYPIVLWICVGRQCESADQLFAQMSTTTLGKYRVFAEQFHARLERVFLAADVLELRGLGIEQRVAEAALRPAARAPAAKLSASATATNIFRACKRSMSPSIAAKSEIVFFRGRSLLRIRKIATLPA